MSRSRGASSDLLTVEIDPASGKSVQDVVQEIQTLPEVEFAEPNYRYELFATPNDPNYPAQTHFAAIRASQAWDVTTGASSVVVAVIDTGVEVAHPDLQANIWRNASEVAADGIDNDENGFVDDVTGYDFVSATTNVAPDEDSGPPDNDPADVQGHGTHVAGIVGAVGNNGNFVTGVAWTVRLMPLRAGYKTPSGAGELLLSDIASALRYAADEGAHIVNMSFGNEQPSLILADALRYAADRGVLLVAAAGNASNATAQYPAAYDRVLSVAATDDTATLAGFSSFGAWVDLAAPGVNVLSTQIGGGIAQLSGTSMAAPLVAGVASLVRASHSTWSAEQIAQALTSTASQTNSTWQKPFGVGLVDAGAAVTAPAALSTFEVAHAQFEELAGDGDGQIEPGESGRLHVAIKNYGPSGGAVITLQTGQSGVTITGSPATVTQVGFTRLATVAFSFALPSSLPVDRPVSFTVTTSAGTRTFADTVTLEPAARWAPERVLAERYAFDHTVTGLPNGSVAVVAELDGNSPDVDGIFATVKLPSGQWTALTQLSGATNAHQPNARVAPDGGLDVVYERNVGPWNNQIFYRKYNPGGGTWSPEEQVTTNAVIFGSGAYTHTNYAVARDSTGRVHVAWVDSASLPRTLRYTTRTATTPWTAPVIVTSFTEPDLLDTKLQMFGLPDGSRRLFLTKYLSDSGTFSELVFSGTGTTWRTPVPVPSLYDSFPTFVQGSNIYRIAKRTHWSDAVELVRWNGASWVTDRTVSPNLTGNWAAMGNVGYAAMTPSGHFGFVVQEPFLEGPFIYYSGLAGGLLPVRATARPQLVTQRPRLFVGPTGAAHAVFTQYPNTGFWITSGQLTYQSNVPDPGMLLPSKPVISTTLTSSQLLAAWSVANPAQVSRYLYAVGTAPGLDDVVRWAKSNSPRITVSFAERPALGGETYYVSVRAISVTGHSGAIGFSPGATLNTCTPEVDSAFCSRLGANCGTVTGTDNCGRPRTVPSCGTCAAPQTCGGGGTPNVCEQACSAETDAAFCARLGKNCGTVSGTDDCGNPRTVLSCGACTSPLTCGGGGTPNVCGQTCSAETDAAFCARLGKNCGTVSGTDNCGKPRTVTSCGACTSPQTCGGGGTPNLCGVPAGTLPCSNLCSTPISFTGPSFQSGSLGTGATCHQTLANINGLNCGNFASTRTFRINDVAVTCNGGNVTLPPKRNGGYCLQASAGDHPWAYFSTW